MYVQCNNNITSVPRKFNSMSTVHLLLKVASKMALVTACKVDYGSHSNQVDHQT